MPYSLGLIEEINPRIDGLNTIAEVFIHVRENCLMEIADLKDGRYPDAEYEYEILSNNFNIDNPKLLSTKWFYIVAVFIRRDTVTNEELPVWSNCYLIGNEQN